MSSDDVDNNETTGDNKMKYDGIYRTMDLIRKGESNTQGRTQVKQQGGSGIGNTRSDQLSVSAEFAASLDVILVLGGGRPLTSDLPPSYVIDRCRSAANMFHLASSSSSTSPQSPQQQQGSSSSPQSSSPPAILTLSAGTAHVSQLNDVTGLPIWESTASADYLIKTLNIPSNKIYA